MSFLAAEMQSVTLLWQLPSQNFVTKKYLGLDISGVVGIFPSQWELFIADTHSFWLL
jgi:hypothetical protein